MLALEALQLWGPHTCIRELIAQDRRLAAAVNSRNIDSLKDSIQEGEAAGLEEKELSLAKELLAQEERKAAAESSGSGGRRVGVYLQEAYHDMFQRWKASK